MQVLNVVSVGLQELLRKFTLHCRQIKNVLHCILGGVPSGLESKCGICGLSSGLELAYTLQTNYKCGCIILGGLPSGLERKCGICRLSGLELYTPCTPITNVAALYWVDYLVA